MSKNVVHKIKVSKEEFRKIKKGKQTLIIRLNDEEYTKIKSKEKVVIQGKVDRFKKAVKETHTYPTLEDLVSNVKKEQLGYKKKDTPNYEDLVKEYKKEDIKKYGILGIELKPKKHIFRKILLGVLILVLLFLSYCFVRNKLDEMNTKKINNTINELAKERTDYVFIEINPSFVLSIKDNKVNNVSCLNDDCVSIYDDIDIKNRTISESVDNLYNLVKNKGFDTSNGVKIKTTIDLNIEDRDYITIEFINQETKDKLLSNVKNNEGINKNSNDDYYSSLWDKLKKDNDYGKVYSCSMNNNELECYFIMDSIITDPNKTDIATYEVRLNRIANTFNKFNIKHDYKNAYDLIMNQNDWNVFIGNTHFILSEGQGFAATVDGVEVINKQENQVLELPLSEDEEYTRFLPLRKLNLINPTSSLIHITSWESVANEYQN